jgi:hypothetical protein
MFREYLQRTYQALTRGRKPRLRRLPRAGGPTLTRLIVEGLEDRTLLSTIIMGLHGDLVYTPTFWNGQRSLNLSHSSATHRYTILDTAENITLAGSFISPSGSGTHTVSFGDGNITSLVVKTLDHDFTVNIEQTVASAPVEVDLGRGNEVVNISPAAHNLNNIQGAIYIYYVDPQFTGDVNGSVNIYDQANTAAHTFTLDVDGNVSRSGAVDFIGINSITINAGDGNNTFNVSGTAYRAGTTLNTGNGHDTVNVDGTGFESGFVINEGTGGVDVNLGATTHSLGGLSYVFVNGGVVGLDNLVLDDTADTMDTTYTVGTNLITPSDSVFSLAYIHYNNLISTLTLEGGSGADTFNVKGTGAPVTLIAHGHATVNVGDNGSVQQIGNDLTISDPPAYATINVDDSADATAPHPVTVGPDSFYGAGFGSITGLATGAIRYKYGDTSTLTVQTGGFLSSATVNVLATGVPVSLMAHGLTTVNIGSAGSVQQILAPLTITDPTSVATVNVDDSADGAHRTVTLDMLTINGSDYGIIGGLGSADIRYKYGDTATVTVQTGTGGATVNVLATGVLTSLVGHATGTVNIGNAGSVQQIRGQFTISDPPAFAFVNVNVDDSLDGTSPNVTLDSVTLDGSDYGRITGLAPAPILYRYADTTSATIDTGPGGAMVHALASGRPVYLVGNPSAGGVSLVGSDADSTWNVTGHNAGTLQSSQSPGTVTFYNVQNLTGGTGADTFVFADGAGIDGTIDGGGGGTNALDYSAYSSSVLVDLQTGSATGVGGGIANIQNVTGGSGGGAGVYNILVGNGGNVLTGGDGRRNLLIAGASASTLIGGNDDDILIGGTTAYDTEAGMVSLQAIMDYWSNTSDDYAARVANLLSGNGVPLLDATMVTNNGGGNTLMGNQGGAGEMNLFYGMDPTLETTDFNAAIGEQFINC